MIMKSELIIIGGGIVGLYSAYFLAEKGFNDILILEKSYLGSGSTFRCATGIRASFTTEEHIVLLKESINLWKNLSRELGFYYEQGGYIWLFRNEEQLKAFTEFSKLHNKFGVPTRIISVDEIVEKVPVINPEGLVGGLFDPIAGKASPFETIYALKRELEKRGVKIKTMTEVRKIIAENGRIKGVETVSGTFEADKVLIAAGYGSRELAKTINVDLPLNNVPHHALVTEKFKEAFKPLLIDWTYSAYIVQVQHGNFLMGMDIEEKPQQPLYQRVDFIPKMARVATRLFPWMRNVNVLRYWTGYYVMSPDRHPIIGPVEEVDGLYIATGFSGHGFMMAPIAGEVVSEWIVDGKPKYRVAENLTLRRIKEGKLIHEKAVFG